MGIVKPIPCPDCSGVRTCGQEGCNNPGAHRFTWPGKDEDVICDECVPKLKAVAEGMGMRLAVVHIDEWDASKTRIDMDPDL
jgi:hypothetical protein